jgi:hypothetical protein
MSGLGISLQRAEEGATVTVNERRHPRHLEEARRMGVVHATTHHMVDRVAAVGAAQRSERRG